ncbi:MAG: hypothetical protein J6Y20_10915 [Lachnospiraceae bacterium]|nr:hypothetical protein [Lachnospiraceae bacterium]
MDATKLFDGHAENYTVGRPGYARELIDCLYDRYGVKQESDPLNRDLYRIYRQFCPTFKGFNGGLKKDDPRITEFFRGEYEFVSFDNPLQQDRDTFLARSLSGSYSLKAGDDRYEEYMKTLTDTFERYAVNGVVTVANGSVAYIGTV